MLSLLRRQMRPRPCIHTCAHSCEGVGSSPTIVGRNGSPELVVVTDGELPMNIRFFKTSDGSPCGAKAVTFDGLRNTTSEQSVVVAENRALVVNNWWDQRLGKVTIILSCSVSPSHLIGVAM